MTGDEVVLRVAPSRRYSWQGPTTTQHPSDVEAHLTTTTDIQYIFMETINSTKTSDCGNWNLWQYYRRLLLLL